MVVHDGQAWHPFSVSLPDVDFSGTRLTYEDREGNKPEAIAGLGENGKGALGSARS